MRFSFTELSDAELALQSEVREFLARELPRGGFTPGLGMAAPRDPDFSRLLAVRGWVGMALPAEYGGGDRSAVERFIVVEELLRWGAPVGFHWVADRQTGPMLARFGAEEQKRRFLPAICRGELSFSIGMSEPGAGSDLAAISTRACQVDGGWSVTGTKIWTGGAHVNDWFVVLCRTSEEEDRRRDDSSGGQSSESAGRRRGRPDSRAGAASGWSGGGRARVKHEGLSQLIVDLRSPGLTARPIEYLDGQAFFCEVTLEEVFVPDELVLGEVGQGWAQNTSELAFERAGPERWLSTYLLVEEALRRGLVSDGTLGELLSQWWAIRALSLSVARSIDAGAAPAAESALVKELGTRFEQEALDTIWNLVDGEPDLAAQSPFERLLAWAILGAPSFTIRGGTNEILRTVAARTLLA